MVKIAKNSATHSAPRKVPFFLFIAGIALAIWLMLRLVLWVDVGPSQLSLAQAIESMGMGLWFDLNALCFLLVPFLLASLLSTNLYRT